MNKLTLLSSLVVLLLAIGYVELRRPDPSGAADSSSAPPPQRPETPAARDMPEWARSLETQIADLRAGQERLEARLEAASGGEPDSVPPVSPAPDPDAPPTAAPDAAPSQGSEKAEQVREFLAKLRGGSITEEEIGEIWNTLVGSGAEDEAIAAFREFIKEHPNDPNGYYGLGASLSAKIVGGNVSFLEQGRLGGEADRMYSKTLELDDQHFGARFSKAYGLTFWPESAGVGPVAIKHFEILRERHGRDRSNELMQEVYVALGEQYRKAGRFDKAAEVFREGLRTFPDSTRLKAQVEALDK